MNINELKYEYFEWDEAKRKINSEKHKIDFADATEIFNEPFYTFQDTRENYGEDRYVSIGLLKGFEIAVVHTPRGNGQRIISVRRARIEERKKYYEEVSKNVN